MRQCVTFRGTGSDLFLCTKAQVFALNRRGKNANLSFEGSLGVGRLWRCEFKKQQKKTPPHLHSCMHCLLYNQHLELVYIKQMVQSNARRLQLPGKQRDSCSFETRLKKN